MTEIKFGATVGFTTNQLSDFRDPGGYIQAKLQRQAEDLGRMIMEKKMWTVNTDDNGITHYDVSLYVFTPAELKEYLHETLRGKV